MIGAGLEPAYNCLGNNFLIQLGYPTYKKSQSEKMSSRFLRLHGSPGYAFTRQTARPDDTYFPTGAYSTPSIVTTVAVDFPTI